MFHVADLTKTLYNVQITIYHVDGNDGGSREIQ